MKLKQNESILEMNCICVFPIMVIHKLLHKKVFNFHKDIKDKYIKIFPITTKIIGFDKLYYTAVFEGNSPLDTGCKLNVHKTFRGHSEHLLNVVCTLNLTPVYMGRENYPHKIINENHTIMHWCLISIHGRPGAIHWGLVTVHWSLSRSIHRSMTINCNTTTFVLSTE